MHVRGRARVPLKYNLPSAHPRARQQYSGRIRRISYLYRYNLPSQIQCPNDHVICPLNSQKRPTAVIRQPGMVSKNRGMASS